MKAGRLSLLAAALAVVATALQLTLLSSWGGAGPDPDLWTFAALDSAAGRGHPLPPLWPLVAGLLPGPPATLAVPLGLLCVAVAAAATTALARLRGAPVFLAVGAGVGLAVLPEPATFAAWVGPDALLTALVALTALLVDRVLVRDRPSPALLLPLPLLLAAVLLARELGPVLALALALPLLLQARRQPTTALAALAGLLLAALSPVLLGQDWLPTGWEWMGRVDAALGGDVPREVPADVAAAGPLRRAGWILGRAPALWGLFGMAGYVAWKDRRPGLGLPLLAALPALVVWSEPRHIAVLAPVALAALASHRAPNRESRLTVAMPFFVVALVRWPDVGATTRDQAADLAALRALGAELCEKAAPGDLAAGEPRAFVGCPLPRTTVPQAEGAEADEGPPPDPTTDGAAWKAWVAADEPPGPGWERAPLDHDRYLLWRLSPGRTGTDRPCADSMPAAATRTFPAPPRRAELLPPCTPADALPKTGLQRARDRLEKRD